MKRKIFNIFFMILLILLVFSVKVEAKFDSSTAELKCESNDLYIEILKEDQTTAIAGPTEVNNSTWSYSFTPSEDLPKHFYIHYYIEPGEVKSASVIITPSTEGIEKATALAPTVDTGGRNSVEGMVEITLADINIEGKGVFVQLTITGEKLDNPRNITVNFNKSSETKNAEAKKIENERRKQLLENSYKTNPGSTTDFETIYYYILSDNKYNDTNGLKNMTDKTILESWKATLNGTNPDSTHYTTENINKIMTLIDEQIAVLNGEKEEISDEALNAVEALVAAERQKLRDLTTGVTGSRGDQGTFTDVLDNIENYKPADLDSTTSNKVGNIADKILTAITNIGMIVAVLMIAILGIKYMLASVEEKAEYKKDAIPYLIGAILLFGILSFVKIFSQWGQTIANI